MRAFSFVGLVGLLFLLVVEIGGFSRTFGVTLLPNLHRYDRLDMCSDASGEEDTVKGSKKIRIGKINSGIKRSMSKSVSKKPKRQEKMAPPTPEFSRVLNLNSIPERKSVLCRLLANEVECAALAGRYEVPEIVKFGANVTISREVNGIGLLVEGDFCVEIGSGSDLLPTTDIQGQFDTNLLINVDGSLSFDEAIDYDDEVDESGDIDIGEIAAQYFGIEMFS